MSASAASSGRRPASAAPPGCGRIDWDSWRPAEDATLLFVLPGDGRVLLIEKKRGLGAGLINAPGGRIEPGESPLQAALRETREELRIHVAAAQFAGRLRFQFLDGYRLRVFVFRTDRFEGTPTETAEAVPMWLRTDALPFERMWADDAHWLPLLLAGRRFDGRFVFDERDLLWHTVSVVPSDGDARSVETHHASPDRLDQDTEPRP